MSCDAVRDSHHQRVCFFCAKEQLDRIHMSFPRGRPKRCRSVQPSAIGIRPCIKALLSLFSVCLMKRRCGAFIILCADLQQQLCQGEVPFHSRKVQRSVIIFTHQLFSTLAPLFSRSLQGSGAVEPGGVLVALEAALRGLSGTGERVGMCKRLPAPPSD